MKLREDLLRGIYAYGFERPSAIQQRAILPCVEGLLRACMAACTWAQSCVGHDVIAQAQSGTGKTATFAISVLQKIDLSLKDTQALLLAPTRELAQQVCLAKAPRFQAPPSTQFTISLYVIEDSNFICF